VITRLATIYSTATSEDVIRTCVVSVLLMHKILKFAFRNSNFVLLVVTVSLSNRVNWHMIKLKDTNVICVFSFGVYNILIFNQILNVICKIIILKNAHTSLKFKNIVKITTIKTRMMFLPLRRLIFHTGQITLIFKTKPQNWNCWTPNIFI